MFKADDGELWIGTFRQKTKSSVRVPLLTEALELIERYKTHPGCLNGGFVLPVFSNQKVNEYLKEIAAVCEMRSVQVLDFHRARYTFATTITLSNGVPIETVSRMLGHSNIRQTQHYAKILDTKVSQDMRVLKSKRAQHQKM